MWMPMTAFPRSMLRGAFDRSPWNKGNAANTRHLATDATGNENPPFSKEISSRCEVPMGTCHVGQSLSLHGSFRHICSNRACME